MIKTCVYFGSHMAQFQHILKSEEKNAVIPAIYELLLTLAIAQFYKLDVGISRSARTKKRLKKYIESETAP